MELSVEQLACVNARDGIFIVTAGPGSGKSTVLIQRHLTMLMNGVPQEDILNLTFTSSAAETMVKKAGMKDNSIFRTFHSFCMELLNKEREYLPFQLCPTVIPVEMENYKALFDLTRTYPAIRNWETLQEKISQWKRTGVSPEEALDETENLKSEYFFALAYYDYEERSRNEGWLDFDSVIEETLKLLRSNEEVRNRWKRKYLAIDECQDTDICQAEIVTLLFNGNVFCVGDFNQCIYEWRSAAPDSLTNAVKKLGATNLFLGRNYRSTKRIVEFLKAILPVDNGLASHMSTDNEEGQDPTFTRYLDDYEEAEEVLKKANQDPTNSAIIARTNRQLFKYQKMCALAGIKYKFLGKRDFFEQPEVKKLLEIAKKSNSSLPATEVLQQIIRDHRLLEIYNKSTKPMENNPVENLNDIVKMAAKKGTIKEFLDWLRKVTYARKSAKGLTLSTAHQSKGTEFNKVYVIGVNQGIMPHKDGELDEESRIFFVSASRAAKELHFSFYENLSMFVPENYRDMVVEYEPEAA